MKSNNFSSPIISKNSSSLSSTSPTSRESVGGNLIQEFDLTASNDLIPFDIGEQLIVGQDSSALASSSSSYTDSSSNTSFDSTAAGRTKPFQPKEAETILVKLFVYGKTCSSSSESSLSDSDETTDYDDIVICMIPVKASFPQLMRTISRELSSEPSQLEVFTFPCSTHSSTRSSPPPPLRIDENSVWRDYVQRAKFFSTDNEKNSSIKLLRLQLRVHVLPDSQSELNPTSSASHATIVDAKQALLDAIRSNNLDQVKVLTSQHCQSDKPLFSINAVIQKTQGFRVLTAACNAKCDSTIIQYLLDVGADPLLFDQTGLTAVHCAARRGRTSHLLVLYHFFKKHNQSSALETFASHECVAGVYKQWTPLLFAITSGNNDTFDFIIRHVSANHIRRYRDHSKRSYLHHAAKSGSLHAVQVLLSQDVPLDVRDLPNRHTPLMMAASQTKINNVKALCASPNLHTTINMQDANGDSALHHAFSIGVQRISAFCEPIVPDQLEVALILIVYGSIDVTLKNKDDDSALDLLSSAQGDLFDYIVSNKHRIQQHASKQNISQWVSLSLLLKKSSSFFQGNQHLVIAYKKEMEEILKELNSQGGCPIFSVGNQKSRRRKPINASSMIFSGNAASSKEGGQEGAKCPFGYTSESQQGEEKKSFLSNCPFSKIFIATSLIAIPAIAFAGGYYFAKKQQSTR
mmetsp:Transcript_15612/g.23409  ORF Transcript_15612/g.23409 Transcript_15612/m.23409 type:complete len:690 (+) Transcript_15612:1-2070(+)